MHSMKLSLVSFLITLMLLYEADGDIVTVRTKYGDIRGTVKVAPPIYGSAVTSVNTFLGIPFAAPPVGELRFQPPKPAQSWKPSVYDATSFRKVCIQKRELFEEAFKKVIPNFEKSNYGEDCLYLNVYAPAQNDSLNPSTKYPVMVYIHGGGFVVGSAIVNDGLGLSTYGVVVVTIQYRLGPFGFLSTGDSAAPGNYGMLDQVQALKWVKENIKNFGGDPNKITIFGLSAGGASVSLHLLSRLSANLFHRAISESGVYLSPWAVASPQVAKSRTVQLGKKTGCEFKELDKLVDCLKKKDAWNITLSGGDLWSPVVDKTAGENAFLLDMPHNLAKAGEFKKAPYMVGFMPNEGALFLPQLQNMTLNLILFRATMKVYASTGFDADKDKERIQMVQDALEFQYTPWGETADPLKLRQGVVDLTGDSWFVAPSVQVCKEHSAHAQTFLFEVNYRPSFALSAKWMGATHGDNIWLDFGPPFFDSPPYNADDKNVSLLVMNMYTNFAKLGIPTPEPLFNGMKWTAFNSTNLAYLRIQPDPDMKNNLLPHRMAFWNHYHPQLVKSARQCNSTDNSGVKSGAGSTCPSFAITLFMIFGLCFMFQF